MEQSYSERSQDCFCYCGKYPVGVRSSIESMESSQYSLFFFLSGHSPLRNFIRRYLGIPAFMLLGGLGQGRLISYSGEPGLPVFLGPAIVGLFIGLVGNAGVVWILAILYLISACLTKFITLPDNAKTINHVKV